MLHRDRGSATFLMELVIAVLFFSMCAAVCLSMFGKSADIAVRSTALNEAVVRSSSLAEVYKEERGDLAGISELLSQMDEDAREVRLTESAPAADRDGDAGAGGTDGEDARAGGEADARAGGECLEVVYEDMTLRLEPEGKVTAGITALASGELAERGTFKDSEGEIYSLKVRCAGGY